MRVWHRRAARWIAFATLPAAAACSLFYPFDDITIGEGPRDGAADGAATGDAAPGDALPSDVGPPETSSPGCPGGRGPAMVRVRAGNVDFCIDSTEVTRSQYQEFLGSSEGKVQPPPPACSFNTSFAPVNPPDPDSSLPVVRIDWCDAYAFCAWAGKRLCGAIGGGSLSLDATTDFNRSEWMFACSKNGANGYPYGPNYNDGACNDNDIHLDGSAAVGSLRQCQGGYDGIFDMAGNVAEWENACNGVPGIDACACALRGSSYKNNEGHCSYSSPDDATAFASDWGIRCCADVRDF